MDRIRNRFVCRNDYGHRLSTSGFMSLPNIHGSKYRLFWWWSFFLYIPLSLSGTALWTLSIILIFTRGSFHGTGSVVATTTVARRSCDSPSPYHCIELVYRHSLWLSYYYCSRYCLSLTWNTFYLYVLPLCVVYFSSSPYGNRGERTLVQFPTWELTVLRERTRTKREREREPTGRLYGDADRKWEREKRL